MNDKVIKNNWLGRSLENYKAQHSKTAQDKKVSDQFQAARSLTVARRVLWGVKSKRITQGA